MSAYYNDLVIKRNLDPVHKIEKPTTYLTQEGVNAACGDHITLSLCVHDDVIVDGGFVGDGCAISQSSTDIIIDVLIGKTKKEALKLYDEFSNMINGRDYNKNALGEATAFEFVQKMRGRTKCAMLGWNTMKKILGS